MDPADASPSPALLDALWAVVARHGWHGTTFARVAAESGESLADLRARHATPVDLLRTHARAVDRFVLEGTVPDPDGTTPARDRLFDLLMRRFDALAPHRAGVLRLQRDLLRDPISAIALSPILLASMAWTLEGAGVPTGGPAGVLRVQGLAGVWIAVSRAWADDESVDLGATMAALDRALDRAEKLARTLRLDAGDPPAAAPSAPFPDPMPEPIPEPLPPGASDLVPDGPPDIMLAAANLPAPAGRFPELPDAAFEPSPADAMPALPPTPLAPPDTPSVTPPAGDTPRDPPPGTPPRAPGPERPGEGPDPAARSLA